MENNIGQTSQQPVSAQQRFLASFGEDNLSWAPLFQDNKLILEQLKSPDEMVVFEAVSNLQNQLSIAQDNTLSNFAVDQYIPTLLEVLKRYPESDISNEINMFSIQCLTHLMDIYPNICNSIVTHGGVKCFALVLERSMGYIDLNEACIKALDKISIENPHAILTSGAMGLVLNMIDFFEINTQKRIISILLNISKHSASESDLNEHLFPVIPCLCMFLQARGGGAETASKIESVSLIILKIFESIFRFISPHSQPEKLAQQIEQLGQTGIVDAILTSLQDYQEYEQTVKASTMSSPLIKQTSSESNSKLMTNLTIQNFLKTLSFCCSYSLNMCKMILGFNILKLVETFLPSQEDQKQMHYSVETFPMIIETLSLIDSLLPSREDDLLLPGPMSEAQIAQAKHFKEKRTYFTNHDMQDQIFFAAEKILPRIFNVHENNSQGSIRSKTLQTIDKLITLFNQEILNSFIEPYSFAKFIYSNLRTNQLPATLQCLQMVDKLMKSNPQSYTLPLIREGVTLYIKQLSTLEQIEKLSGVSMTESETLDSKADFLQQAKNALQKAEEGSEQQEVDRRILEQTLHKYMEIAKLQALGNPAGSVNAGKVQAQTGKQIVALAENLQRDFFENQSFIAAIYEQSGDELKTLQTLKKLAEDLVQEAKQIDFCFERNRDLMKAIGDMLTKDKPLLSYELKESGLLDALNAYLTMTPKQIEIYQDKQKLAGQEEQKKSEEVAISALVQNATQISKKQAKCYIWRLKVFLHVMVNKYNDKQPINELVNICHDIISQNDFLIFESSQSAQDPLNNPFSHAGYQNQINDPNSSMSALRQLTKRMRINMVYDPSKSSVAAKKQFESPTKPSSFDQPLLMQKSSSHHPAFMVLSDQNTFPGLAQEAHSKVYVKRNFLYGELKQVLVSVEQCASLFLLEDFLRNRIRTMEDVKTLKTPASQYGSSMKHSSSSRGINNDARLIMDQALDKMRNIIESNHSREGMRLKNEEFANDLIEEIVGSTTMSEMDQIDLIRQLELQSLQLIDDYYAEHDNQFDDHLVDAGEGAEDEELDTEEKLNEFQNTIQKLRETFKKKKIEQITSRKKAKQLGSLSKTTEDAVMADSSLSEVSEEEKKKDDSSLKKEDVDMTDEEEEEQRRHLERATDRRFVRSESDAQAFLIGASETGIQEEQPEAFSEDLEQLIKANGEDIEYEFYVAGEKMVPNQTIYEILKIVENKARKQKDSALSSMSANIGSFLTSYHGGDQVTIHFAIKDKAENLQKQRKDSIMEFKTKRERSKSEAVNDISVSSVNQFVQMLIEKEFQVFEKGELGIPKQEDKHSAEKRQLQSALKVLKVINFLCRNTNLFSSQGIKFLVSQGTKEDEEMKEDGFQDLDLQVGLSQLHSNLFHHHKLDAYILRNIQDPYNLISGSVSEILNSIFKNCEFLFPFQTRLLFFKLISFIGSIDMNRSIYFLKQFLKQKLGKLPPEDKHAVKQQRQKVIVDRTKILECSLNLISKVSNRAFLEVEYKDEVGTGLGPTMEYYYLVASDIKNFSIPSSNPKQNIWRQGMADNSLYPSPLNLQKIGNEDLQKVYDVFRLTGMMIAKSISDDKLIDLPLSPLFWDLVLGKKMNIFDLERIEPSIYKVFADLQVLANKKRDIEKAIHVDQDHKQRQINTLKTASGARIEDLSLVFTLPGFDSIELKHNGKDEDVTLNNLQEYIDLTMHFFFQETVKVQIQAFKKGFNQIFPVESLRPFSNHSTELEDMICGTQRNEEEWTSVVKLSEFIVPAHGFHPKSPQYQMFLRFITELDKEERRKFLKFVTGSPRLPNGGFGSLDPKLTVVLKKAIIPPQYSQDMINTTLLNDEILPSVMTCQNYVKLPPYSNYEILKMKFEQAYNEGCNSFTLS